MDFRTIVSTGPSPLQLTHAHCVLLIGSCFAAEIGEKLQAGKMKAMVNPSGTVYNPCSAAFTLDAVLEKKIFSRDDLYFYRDSWLSFRHYTEFSDSDPDRVLDAINTRNLEASGILEKARALFITFGTARIYRFGKTGEVVSNCHKLPAREFTRELLSVEDITQMWEHRLDTLGRLFPGLKVVFTISPVRHLKDGAHGNQVSKAILLLAVERLLQHPSQPLYFPAYEILMDDLRDYRFYADDMIHPSGSAVSYIWDSFRKSFMTEDTQALWTESEKITRAVRHRFLSPDPEGKRTFAETLLRQIDALEKKTPDINLSAEREYFLKLVRDHPV